MNYSETYERMTAAAVELVRARDVALQRAEAAEKRVAEQAIEIERLRRELSSR